MEDLGKIVSTHEHENPTPIRGKELEKRKKRKILCLIITDFTCEFRVHFNRSIKLCSI